MPKIPPPFSNLAVTDWVNQLHHATDAEERLRAIQAIGLLGESDQVVCSANLALSDADSTVRAFAAKLLGSSKTLVSADTESRLVSLLADTDPDVRFESARALIRLKSRQSSLAIPVLLSLLDEPETNALMVAAVINALVEIDRSETAPEQELQARIQKLLDHERAEVREAVANAFARWPIMTTSLTKQLLPLLDDPEPIVREKIAYAFGQAGVLDDAIRSTLESASDDEDQEVAREAREALRILTSNQ